VRRGETFSTFHEPLNPGSFAGREDLMEAVRAAIAAGLPEWMREKGDQGTGIRDQ
jgi:hypothetical protein